MASIEELVKQVEVQCASLDSYHLLEEQWRKDKIKLELKVDSLTKINDALIKLGDRLQDIIENK